MSHFTSAVWEIIGHPAAMKYSLFWIWILQKIQNNNISKTCSFFLQSCLAIQPPAEFFRFGWGDVGVECNRVIFIPQILGILPTLIWKFINIHFWCRCQMSDVRWCLRNSVSLRVILMLANTTKYVGSPQQCMTNSEESEPKNPLLLTTTRKPAAHLWYIAMSNVTKMKLLVLVVTYSLAGLYTSLEVKLCGLRMKLNSTYNHEIRPRRENWQQSRSRKKWLQTWEHWGNQMVRGCLKEKTG